MMIITELPFERMALNNLPMPDDLSLADQMMYVILPCLYQAHKANLVTKEQAKAIKQQCMARYEKGKDMEKSNADWCRTWKRCEKPARDWAMEPTKENGDKLYAAIYRLPDEWRLTRNLKEIDNNEQT